jgi:outer membrane protein TolC
VAERQAILDVTQRRFDRGLENEASLDEAKALLATSRMKLQHAGAERDLAAHAVAALVGHGPDIHGNLGRTSVSVEKALPVPAHLPADLLARRPDILAARAASPWR